MMTDSEKIRATPGNYRPRVRGQHVPQVAGVYRKRRNNRTMLTMTQKGTTGDPALNAKVMEIILLLSLTFQRQDKTLLSQLLSIFLLGVPAIETAKGNLNKRLKKNWERRDQIITMDRDYDCQRTNCRQLFLINELSEAPRCKLSTHTPQRPSDQ